MSQPPSERTVLFLCTGNYYRSRLAEILFNDHARRRGLPWRADSRALALELGSSNIGPISRLAIACLQASGVAADAACARFPVQAKEDDLSAAALIIALKQAEHAPMVATRFPEWAGRIRYWHVDDAPEAVPLVERHVEELIEYLADAGDSSLAFPPKM